MFDIFQDPCGLMLNSAIKLAFSMSVKAIRDLLARCDFEFQSAFSHAHDLPLEISLSCDRGSASVPWHSFRKNARKSASFTSGRFTPGDDTSKM